jgi:hypothetical protein
MMVEGNPLLAPPNQDQIVSEPEPKGNNLHLQVGFGLMPDIQKGQFFNCL